MTVTSCIRRTTRHLLLLPLVVAAGLAACTAAAPTPETFDVGMLRVERTGPEGRDPVILIPALFCGPWQWERQIAALGRTHEVYALTLPGFDGRPRDDRDSLMTRAVADLAELIRARAIDHPVIIGHSLGGTLAIRFAETYPDLAGAIVSVEGGRPIAPTPAEREQRIQASVAPYRGIADSALEGVLREHMLQYVITSDSIVDLVAHLAARSDPMALVRWMQAALALDLSPDLAAVQVPMTMIVPYDSIIDPYQGFTSEAAKRAAYEAWLAPAPRASVVMIPNARHFVMYDQPEAFDRALASAITSVSGQH